MSEEGASSGELYAVTDEKSSPEDAISLVDEAEELERVTYERYYVELDDGLVEEMKKFNTKKLQDVFDDKDEGSKLIKSGKVIHIPSLNELSAQSTFFTYLQQLGFEGLGNNEMPDVPVRLAKELFTTFRFCVTTDLDEVSIGFRLYGMEVEMSLTEWTVRMGICTLEEAISPEWRGRERGIPRRHVDFDAQEAWGSLTHPQSGQFQATQSRSYHLSNPILRLVQLYLGYNLLDQSNYANRTSLAELYLLWCIKIKRKAHLRFWTTYQFHLIATHPARNLSICNLLGAFVTNNLQVHVVPETSPLFMCDPPGLFDMNFFIRTGIVYIREGALLFYKMGENALPSGNSVVAAGNREGENKKWEQVGKVMAGLIEENQMQGMQIQQQGVQINQLSMMVESLVVELRMARGFQDPTGSAQVHKIPAIHQQPPLQRTPSNGSLYPRQ